VRLIFLEAKGRPTYVVGAYRPMRAASASARAVDVRASDALPLADRRDAS
jgi:hypothetical protein